MAAVQRRAAARGGASHHAKRAIRSGAHAEEREDVGVGEALHDTDLPAECMQRRGVVRQVPELLDCHRPHALPPRFGPPRRAEDLVTVGVRVRVGVR
eukprot:scaffold46425_cov33-Phaeocystis_antarctica.AAC.1